VGCYSTHDNISENKKVFGNKNKKYLNFSLTNFKKGVEKLEKSI
jgi:hypothetical protein